MRSFFYIFLQENPLVFTVIGRLLICVHIPIIWNTNSCNYWVVKIYLTYSYDQVLDLQRFEPRFPDSHVDVLSPCCPVSNVTQSH